MTTTDTTPDPSSAPEDSQPRDEVREHAVDPSRGQAPDHHIRRPRDWAWRRRIRANRQTHRIYRAVIATIGGMVVVGGLVTVPLPGPGWLIVFIGVSIWASEFHWARRLHEHGMRTLRRWNDWVMHQNMAVRGGIVVLTCLFVNAVLWTTLKFSGVPGWVPEPAAGFMRTHLAL